MVGLVSRSWLLSFVVRDSLSKSLSVVQIKNYFDIGRLTMSCCTTTNWPLSWRDRISSLESLDSVRRFLSLEMEPRGTFRLRAPLL